MKKYIIISGNFEFPDGNAAGKRVAGFGRILRHLGFIPVFVGFSKNPSSENILETKTEINGAISYQTVYARSVKQYLCLHSKIKLFFDVVKDLGEQNVCGVILYRSITLSLWMNAIIKWCRKKSKPVLVDCSDWMPFSCESFLRHIVKWLDVNYQNNVIPKRADGVVVVSSYIDNLFKSRNCRTMLVPHVFDCAEMDACRRTYPYSPGSVRRFVYTGIPFQVGTKTPKSHFKDRLDRSIELFYHLFKKGYKFRFDVYGLTAENYLYTVPEHASILQEMDSYVVFHGLCSSDTIIEAICTADMVILNRDDTLITRAGFPTKVAEAMALGTPVVTEPTSNIADYIKHGVNGFLFDWKNEAQLMEQIMELPVSELENLRENCIHEPQFDYKKYVDRFAAIFK